MLLNTNYGLIYNTLLTVIIHRLLSVSRSASLGSTIYLQVFVSDISP